MKLIPTESTANSKFTSLKDIDNNESNSTKLYDNQVVEESNTGIKMTEEDFDKITNPKYYAFRNAIESLKSDLNKETITLLHNLLLGDISLQNRLLRESKDSFISILNLLPTILNRDISILFSDIVHLNPEMSKVLVNNDIFTKLDYNAGYSYCLIFNICDSNLDSWNKFKAQGHELCDKNNEFILKLKNQHDKI